MLPGGCRKVSVSNAGFALTFSSLPRARSCAGTYFRLTRAAATTFPLLENLHQQPPPHTTLRPPRYLLEWAIYY